MGVKLTIITSSARIAKSFGYGASSISIITSAVLALISFFYVYTLASYLKIDIYFLQNRITYYTFFHNYVINKYSDHLVIVSGIFLWLVLSINGKAGKRRRHVVPLVYGGLTLFSISANLGVLLDVLALLSIPFVVSLLVYNRFFAATEEKFLKTHTDLLYVNYLVIIGIVTGIISLVMTTLTPLYSSTPAFLQTPIIPNYAHGLYVLFSSACPVLIFLLIFCLPVKLVLREFMTKIFKVRNTITTSFLSYEMKKTRSKLIFLFFFMLLSIIIAAIPHEPLINRTNQYVGTDTAFYVDLMNKLAWTHNPQEFILKAFTLATDRPLSILFLFTIAKIVPASASFTIDRVPFVLGPALVLVFYFLTRELTSNDTTSVLAAFLTAISFHTLIGIYAGFYANWLGIIIGYMSFVFLIKFLKTERRVNFAIYSGLIVMLLFTHVYTWTIFTIVMGIFLLVLYKLNYYRRQSIILLLIVVLSSVAIDVARTIATGSVGGVEGDIALSKGAGGVGLGQFAQRWSNLVYTTQVYLGGQLSNPIILMLGLYWLFHSKRLEQSTIFIIVFLSIGLLPLFVGGVLIQGRVFYDIPFQIPAAIGLTYVKRRSNGTLLLLAIGIWLVAMSVNAASNYYLVPS